MSFSPCLRRLSMSGLLALSICASAGEPAARPAEIVQPLMQKALAGMPNKEIVMLTVEYLAAGASLPHRHDAQVFVYVLEGTLKMQVAGGPLQTLRVGETFYESPDDVHTVSANASTTLPAKILVFMVKDKASPATRGVPPAGTR